MPSYGELLDQNCFLKFILMMILPFLVLLIWAEKKVANSNKGEELVGTSSSEIEQLFEEDSELMRHGGLRAYCACSFCGKLSHVTITCSRCKAALYCSKACHVTHWTFWHKYECVGSEADEGHEGSSPSHGTHFLLLDSKKEREEGEEAYIKAKEGEEEYTDGTPKSQLAIVSGHDRCAVCGNPSTKKCSRCKAIKYCSKTCQHFDWRSGHNFRCVVEKENSAQALTDHQEVHTHGNVVLPPNSYAVEDSVDSSGPLYLEFYSSEGKANANDKALILRSQEATRESQEETEELVRSLNEELEMIKKKNISLQSERDKWEKQARYAVDTLYSLRKENEHQMFVLKHENELISNAEDQSRKMLHSLSQRLHNLQIEMEARYTESKRKDEYIHILQNECVKAKTELQEQKKCVQRLTMELDEVTQLPIRIVEATRQKFDVNALSSISAAEFRTPYTTEVKLDHPQSNITKLDDKVNFIPKEFQTVKSLSRNPTYTRQACAVCLTNEKDMAFGCGHMTCRDCGSKIRKCHICRKKISNRIKLFTG